MISSPSNLNRKGISLVEILIGIMVLGIGVISLATLFPLGLLQLKRAVNNTRGAILARDAVAQVRIRNMLGMSMSPTPTVAGSWKTTGSPGPMDGETAWSTPPGTLTLGPGAPVVIDPVFFASA